MKKPKQTFVDFQFMVETERLLRKLGSAEEVATYGHRGTRNFACAAAYLANAKVPFLLPDSDKKNESSVIIKKFDVDWYRDRPAQTLNRLRVIVYGFGEVRTASVETQIRIKILKSALDRVKWGTGELP